MVALSNDDLSKFGYEVLYFSIAMRALLRRCFQSVWFCLHQLARFQPFEFRGNMASRSRR